ncbi:hypothetical protein L3Y34_005951 [Caenorhabditis briggsae]|uniref:Uncharacterized protein n=1 Tax=Caenorhabditis briggsae TaxID=6238 RepID=A0AAE9CY88_CAEBR|nr:hypothetical protein L3Y34_005951 [Caenorhabditis briggsae]
MAAVTHKCEEFLLQTPRVKTIQKIVFADNHNLHKLLRVTLTSIETKEELEALTLLPEFFADRFNKSRIVAQVHAFY